MATAALPPFHAVPVLIVALPLLLWLIDGTPSWRSALAVGWCFGFGHFATGLYWIGNAFMVYADMVGWAAAPAVLLLAAACAVYLAVVAGLYKRIGVRGVGGVVLFAGLWTAAEWLRAHLFTGFPWNLIGYTWAGSDVMIQLAAVTGIYGLSFLTVAAMAMPAVLIHGGRLRPVVAAAAVLAVVWAGGAVRLAGSEVEMVADVRLRLVQANIGQFHKWQPDLAAQHFDRHLAMSTLPGDPPPTHILWPETASPYLLDREPEARFRIAEAVPPGGVLLTGAVRATPVGETPFQIWNSLQAVDGTGAVVAGYDKFHLVPFGEYMPFRWLFSFADLTVGDTDFSAGPGLATVELDGLPPVSPLICYEAIFPGSVVAAGERPEWLLNVTNDGWYGRSTGPYQHLAQARLRAVEEGLPLVRAANTGISVVTDAYGREIARLGLQETGVLDSALPRPTPGRTLYSLVGDATIGAMLALAFAAVAVGEHRRRRST